MFMVTAVFPTEKGVSKLSGIEPTFTEDHFKDIGWGSWKGEYFNVFMCFKNPFFFNDNEVRFVVDWMNEFERNVRDEGGECFITPHGLMVLAFGLTSNERGEWMSERL